MFIYLFLFFGFKFLSKLLYSKRCFNPENKILKLCKLKTKVYPHSNIQQQDCYEQIAKKRATGECITPFLHFFDYNFLNSKNPSEKIQKESHKSLKLFFPNPAKPSTFLNYFFVFESTIKKKNQTPQKSENMIWGLSRSERWLARSMAG